MTTLSGLEATELNHLAGLEKLENLELGDCSEWTGESHYEILSQLSHLRHLRLEHGPPAANVLNYLTSLNQITGLQDLELINFTVNAPLDQLQLSGLKRLLIVPRYAEEVGTIFLKLFTSFPILSRLLINCWFNVFFEYIDYLLFTDTE